MTEPGPQVGSYYLSPDKAGWSGVGEPPDPNSLLRRGVIIDAVEGAPSPCLDIVISGAAPGTTCGNHRADFPGHPGASQGMVSAGQAHEADSVSWALL
jgi:hypothetical protein